MQKLDLGLDRRICVCVTAAFDRMTVTFRLILFPFRGAIFYPSLSLLYRSFFCFLYLKSCSASGFCRILSPTSQLLIPLVLTFLYSLHMFALTSECFCHSGRVNKGTNAASPPPSLLVKISGGKKKHRLFRVIPLPLLFYVIFRVLEHFQRRNKFWHHSVSRQTRAAMIRADGTRLKVWRLTRPLPPQLPVASLLQKRQPAPVASA